MARKKFLFIRNDDVYAYDDNFVNLFTFFTENSIPVVYGVVPKLIEKKLIHFLNKKKRENPDLFDIVQHGFCHANHSKNPTSKYEFGTSRSYKQQKDDILRGYTLMKKIFKSNFTPAFIPPYHENGIKSNFSGPIFSNPSSSQIFLPNVPTTTLLFIS